MLSSLYNLLSIAPLAGGALSVDKMESLTKEVLRLAGPTLQGFTDIGIGIASIFLLFVVFVYVTNILDGGKFQVKMLLPFLVYLCVCNFTLVSGPIVSFVVKLQETCVSKALSSQNATFDMLTDGAYSKGETKGVFGLWVSMAKVNNSKDTKADEEIKKKLDALSAGEDVEDATITENTVQSTTDGTTNSTKTFSMKGIGQNIGNALSKFWKSIQADLLRPFFGKNVMDYICYGFMGILVTLMDWIAQLLNVAITAMGAIACGIVVAFGPITWAFAVFPGNQRVIGSWCIRLCQFALYSPIVALITTFFHSLLIYFAQGLTSLETGGSATACACLILALIASLMQVPSIASMIIEGAQGALSLSQGLSTVHSVVDMAHDATEMANWSKNEGAGGAGAPGGSGPIHP